VEEILKNVKDPRWQKVSVEFCGGTHVRSTGDIKDLVVLEESGIAKGIRRIIAVTGEDAHEAQRVADAFDDQLKQLGKKGNGPEKVDAQKMMQLELDKLAISAVRKSQFRTEMEKIAKDMLKHQKEAQKHDVKQAIDVVSAAFAKDPKQQSAVLSIPAGAGNPKLIAEVLKYVQTKMKDKSVYVLVKKEDEVSHGCIVSPGAAKAGVSSSEWANSVSEVVGGKTFGKAPQAMGNGTKTEAIADAIEKATEYLARFQL
jgi:alanyl-tRNA synthetase